DSSTPLAPASDAGPVPITVQPPPIPAPGEPVELRPGRLLELSPTLRVGPAGTSGSVAHFEVLVGAFSYAVDARTGEPVVAGPVGLVVDAVEADGRVRLRWSREPEGEPTAWVAEHRPRPAPHVGADALVVREMALFVL